MRIREIRSPDEFQSFCQHLLCAEFSDCELVNDSSGDGGIDAYVPSRQTLYAVYCPEIMPAPVEYFQRKIRQDLKKAVNLRDQGYVINNWVFITPAPLSKELQTYLRSKVAEHQFLSGRNESEIHLATLFAKHSHLRPLFPHLIIADLEAQLSTVHASLSSQIQRQAASFTANKLKVTFELVGLRTPVLPMNTQDNTIGVKELPDVLRKEHEQNRMVALATFKYDTPIGFSPKVEVKAQLTIFDDVSLRMHEYYGVWHGSRIRSKLFKAGDTAELIVATLGNQSIGAYEYNLSKRLVDDSKYLTPNYTVLDGSRFYIKVLLIGIAAPDEQIIRKTQWFGIDAGLTPRFIGLLKQPKHLI